MAEKPGPNSVLLVGMVGLNQMQAFPALVKSGGASLTYGNNALSTQGFIYSVQSALQPGYFFATTDFGVEPFGPGPGSGLTPLPPLPYSNIRGLAQPDAGSVYLAGFDTQREVGTMAAATCDNACNLALVGGPQDQVALPNPGVMCALNVGGPEYAFYGGASPPIGSTYGMVVSNQVSSGSFTLAGSVLIPPSTGPSAGVSSLSGFVSTSGVPALVALLDDASLQSINVNPDGTMVLVGTPVIGLNANCVTVVTFPGVASIAVVGTDTQLLTCRVDEFGIGPPLFTLNLASMHCDYVTCSGNLVMVSGFAMGGSVNVGLTRVASDGSFPWGAITTASYPMVNELGPGPCAFYQYWP